MNSHEIFFVGQKAFIEKDGEVLVLNDPDEGLDFPGGRIDEGEINLADSMKREVMEEVGLEIEVGKPFVTWFNAFPDSHSLAGKKVFLIGYRCKYLSGEVKLSHEHNKFKWVSKENYKEIDDGTDYFNYLVKYFEEN